MKRVILPVIVIVIAGVAAYFFIFKKDDKPAAPEDKQKPLAVGEHSSAFMQSFEKLLTAYIGVKEGLVASDTAKANAAARKMVIAADSLKVDEIQADTNGIIKETARTYMSILSSSAKGLAGEATIDEKRKEFEMIADHMWQLTRTVKYDGQKLYWQYCPMAFNDRGAYWMSNEREIRNPYFGDKMLHCGDVKDSLDYSVQN